MNRPVHVVAKRPLKQRSTQTGSYSRIDIKEKWKDVEIGSKSDRVNGEDRTARPMKLSLQVDQPNRVTPSAESESLRRNCKIRFSYV